MIYIVSITQHQSSCYTTYTLKMSIVIITYTFYELAPKSYPPYIKHQL